MTNPLSNVDWDKLTPEEKDRVRKVELWSGRVYSIETTIRGLMSHLEQCGLENEEMSRFRAHLQEIVVIVRMRHNDAVGTT